MTDKNLFSDVFYIDLNNPLINRRFTAPKRQRRRSPALRQMEQQGYVIEKHGAWWHVWNKSPQIMNGVTDEYRTLKEIAAHSNYYAHIAEASK